MKYLLSFMVILLGFSACKNKKDIAATEGPINLNKNKAMTLFQDGIVDFDTFEGKSKIRFEDAERQLSFKATVRVKKDEMIWVSAGMLGFEGVRALITPDSVKVINRLERTYYESSIDYVGELTNMPVNFEGLQNLLVGNWLFFDKDSAKFEEKEGIVELSSEKDAIVNILWLDNVTLLLQRQTLLDQINDRSMEISYHDYRPMDDAAFPYESVIHVSGRDEAWIDMEYSSVELDSNPSFAFSVSDKYERIY
ncbi:MAG: DUF4292 domain-containing protein [Saprospiraceae bacterium]|nr:DUF4292 domain-containing protein [Saprospiraceae bacterium]